MCSVLRSLGSSHREAGRRIARLGSSLEQTRCNFGSEAIAEGLLLLDLAHQVRLGN